MNKFFGCISDATAFYDLLDKKKKINISVLEIGGTSRAYYRDGHNFSQYDGVDIDEEGNKEGVYTNYYNQSCEIPFKSRYDFIFSIFLLEHVPDNNKTFQNIINSLGPSGDSIHLFPLGFHPFSLLTKIVTNSFQKKLISLIRKNTIGITGYPTYYSLCSSFELKTYFSKHPEIEYKVKYLYGAEDYFGFFFPFGIGIHIFNRICNMFNLHIFASNAILTIHRK
jgi:SAM-dependent methyltransferase